MAEDRAYLGKALYLPIQLSKGAGVLSDGVRSVIQSAISILTTPIGSRFMLRSYGSRIEELQFEPNDKVLENMLRLFVIDALSEWERRAEFKDATITFPVEQPDRVDVQVFFRILSSNEIDSFVFPYYRKLLN